MAKADKPYKQLSIGKEILGIWGHMSANITERTSRNLESSCMSAQGKISELLEIDAGETWLDVDSPGIIC